MLIEDQMNAVFWDHEFSGPSPCVPPTIKQRRAAGEQHDGRWLWNLETIRPRPVCGDQLPAAARCLPAFTERIRALISPAKTPRSSATTVGRGKTERQRNRREIAIR